MNYVRTNWARILIDNLIWLIVLVFAVVVSFFSPHFLSFNNITNIFVHASVLGILVVGEALVLMLGYFDLSLESTVGLTAIFGAWLMLASNAGGSGWKVSAFLVMPIMLLIGMGIGYFNGTLITRLKMSPFIVTLAMLTALRGLCFVISSGQTLSGLPAEFSFLGSDNLISTVPLGVFLVIALYIVVQVVMTLRPFGRRIYAVGGNPDAALASGIDPAKVTRGVYVIAGGLAALAGLILAGQLNSVTANAGQGLIFEVFAAAVIGGVSLQGGRGSMMGAFGGVLLLSAIDSALNLTNVSSFWVDVVKGSVILVAVFLDSQKDRLRNLYGAHRATVSGAEAPADRPGGAAEAQPLSSGSSKSA